MTETPTRDALIIADAYSAFVKWYGGPDHSARFADWLPGYLEGAGYRIERNRPDFETEEPLPDVADVNYGDLRYCWNPIVHVPHRFDYVLYDGAQGHYFCDGYGELAAKHPGRFQGRFRPPSDTLDETAGYVAGLGAARRWLRWLHRSASMTDLGGMDATTIYRLLKGMRAMEESAAERFGVVVTEAATAPGEYTDANVATEAIKGEK